MKTLGSLATLLYLVASVACAASEREERSSSGARDLSQYEKGGVFDFPLYPTSDTEREKYDSDNARLREFVWSHWTRHRRGYVRVIHHGIEGQNFIGDHYLEPDRRGQWSMSWSDYEDARIYGIEQIKPRTDHPASRWRFEWMGHAGKFWREGTKLDRPISGDGAKYMLQLRNKKGVIVALF